MKQLKHHNRALNGSFGILIEGVTSDDLENQDFQAEAFELWSIYGGLLIIRGKDLFKLNPKRLVAWSNKFGKVEIVPQSAREDKMVSGFPIFRIGNTKDVFGKKLAQFAKVPELKSDDDICYNPESRRPVWHTDSTFREQPPIGSVFQCRIAPPSGSDTLFADTCKAYADLDTKIQEQLLDLEAICSLAHHDKKISLYSPGYPVLTPNQRKNNPPRRVPIVLKHPVTGLNAIYGINSSTCAVLPKWEELTRDKLDVCDLEGIEDMSVLILRNLLPHITGPKYTVRWKWEAGDIVIWDNRCTIHAATGFDNEKYSREMWRLTLLENSDRILSRLKL